MPTLLIEGKRVKVDDGFLSLSPDEQARTVEEIAGQMGIAAAKPQNAAPEAPVAETGDIYQRRATAEAQRLQEIMPRSGFSNATDSILSGALFGFDDEIMAGLGSIPRMARDGVNPVEAFRREKALQDALKTQRREASPVASMAGEVAGGLLTGGTLAKGGATLIGRNVPMLGRTGAAAAEGAAYGGLYGAGEAESGKRLEGAAKGAALGAATGAATERIGAGISRALSGRTKAPAPSIDDLAAQAKTLYSQAEQAGVTIKPKAMGKVTANMEMAAGRINPNLRPKTAAMVDEIQAFKNRPVSLGELDELRQTVGQAMKTAEPQDLRTLERMKTTLDAFFDNQITPGDITGDIKGFDFIKEARSVYARKAKAQTIAELIDRAKNQATGYENGLVIQFRQLANNPKKMRQFSPEEQRMIKDVVRRGSARNILAMLGRMSPSSTFGGIANLGVAGTTGLLPGAAVAATGYAAQKGAEAMTRAQVGKVADAVARGFTPIPPQFGRVAAPLIPGLTSQAAGRLPYELRRTPQAR